ncbi:MAG: Holliday junction resolvase RuvX [Isosphaeraceae bacterium]
MARILGIDHGLKRIGAALASDDCSFAVPLEVYETRTVELDAEHYRRVVAEYRVDRIVIGLPLSADGSEGSATRRVRKFGRWLSKTTERPVLFHDERYTSAEAESLLRDQGVRSNRRKAKLDLLAAQIILQSYLDAGSPEVEASGMPLEDEVQSKE